MSYERIRDDDTPLTDEVECPICFALPGVAHEPDCLPRRIAKEATDRAIVERVDRWFGGGLVIAFKSHDEGRPNEPMTYLYRSALLDGLGVDEELQ